MNLLPSFVRSALFALLAAAAPVAAQNSALLSPPVLPPGSEAIAVPAGNVVSFRTFATGFQVYRWNATTNTWTFVEPIALLFPLLAGYPIGLHSAGPTWSVPGAGSVVGSKLAASTVDPTAIPWLLLAAVSTSGTGPLAETTFVQRVQTIGGTAPARAGATDEVVYVPYAAQYYFYRAQ